MITVTIIGSIAIGIAALRTIDNLRTDATDRCTKGSMRFNKWQRAH